MPMQTLSQQMPRPLQVKGGRVSLVRCYNGVRNKTGLSKITKALGKGHCFNCLFQIVSVQRLKKNEIICRRFGSYLSVDFGCETKGIRKYFLLHIEQCKFKLGSHFVKEMVIQFDRFSL